MWKNLSCRGVARNIICMRKVRIEYVFGFFHSKAYMDSKIKEGGLFCFSQKILDISREKSK